MAVLGKFAFIESLESTLGKGSKPKGNGRRPKSLVGFPLARPEGFGYTQRNDPDNSFSQWRAILLRSSRPWLGFLLSTALLGSPVFATTTTHKSSSAHKASTSVHSTHRSKSKSHRLHGQQAIDSSRVTEIQQALIREHYLTGDANGNWDATTQAAMQKFQSDNGWQTRLLPDSRALKKLGLGPDYSGAINAEGASFTPPAPATTIPPTQAAGFAAAAGVNR